MQDNIEYLKLQFQMFCVENPLGFDEDELSKIKRDIVTLGNGVKSDEYVDFVLWNKGLKTRQESFAEYIEKVLPKERYHKLLEVGCGKRARLSEYLVKAGYDMTGIDPKIEDSAGYVRCIRGEFDWKSTDISEYDAVVAQEPCEATEHIVRACVQNRKNFVIFLCGTPHRLLTGEVLADVWEWYKYLLEIGGENCGLFNPKLIKGYESNILIGFFKEKEL